MRKAVIPLLLAAAILLLAAPLFSDYVIVTHDTDFHMMRLANLANELRHGQIPVRMAVEWENGYGYPVSIFYGDMLMTPFAVIHLAGVPLFRCFQLFLLALHAALVLLSYHSFKTISGNAWSGLLISVVYAFSMRYISNVFLRGAIGEACAMVFLPLVGLGFYRLLSGEHNRTALCLVAGFSGLLHAHIITTVQAVFFAALFCITEYRVLLRKRTMQTLLTAAGLSVLLNAWFLVPFLDFYARHDFVGKAVGSISMTALPPDALLHPFALHLAPGISLLLLTAVCLLMLPVYANKPHRFNGVTLLLLPLLSLWMTTTLFPWDAMEQKLPQVYAFLGGRMQFTARYLTSFAALACICAACALRGLKSRENTPPVLRKAVCGVFLLLAALSLYEGGHALHSFMSDEEAYPYRFSWITVDHAQALDPVYMLSDVPWWEETVTADTKLHSFEGIVLSDVSRRGTSFAMRVQNTTAETGAIQFPVWNYYGYVASGDHAQFDIADSGSGKIVVPIPASYEGSLTLSFREPLYWRLAELVSVFTVLTCLYRRFSRKNT